MSKPSEKSGKPERTDVWQGTLSLMVLTTLEMLGPLHGFGIARRIEQTSAHRLVLNPGTLYPILLKLEQEGYITSAWGTSDHNRRARFYRLTAAGRRQVDREADDWQNATDIVARFLATRRTR
jgi:transcriptional regulator